MSYIKNFAHLYVHQTQQNETGEIWHPLTGNQAYKSNGSFKLKTETNQIRGMLLNSQ